MLLAQAAIFLIALGLMCHSQAAQLAGDVNDVNDVNDVETAPVE